MLFNYDKDFFFHRHCLFNSYKQTKGNWTINYGTIPVLKCAFGTQNIWQNTRNKRGGCETNEWGRNGQGTWTSRKFLSGEAGMQLIACS